MPRELISAIKHYVPKLKVDLGVAFYQRCNDESGVVAHTFNPPLGRQMDLCEIKTSLVYKEVDDSQVVTRRNTVSVCPLKV